MEGYVYRVTPDTVPYIQIFYYTALFPMKGIAYRVTTTGVPSSIEDSSDKHHIVDEY